MQAFAYAKPASLAEAARAAGADGAKRITQPGSAVMSRLHVGKRIGKQGYKDYSGKKKK